MEYGDLRKALAIIAGEVTVDPARLTPNLGDLWRSAFGDAPVDIGGARPGPGDGQGGAVVVIGTSRFLHVPDLPVELRATLDPAGDVHVSFRYTLRGAEPGPGAWTFRDSFPDLPGVVQWGGAGGTAALLDQLDLFQTACVVVDLPQPDAETGVALLAGINFVSGMRPTGVVATARSVFGQSDPLTLFGTIVLPASPDPVAPVPSLRYPWDIPAPVPGILLQADLAAPATLAGKLVLDGVAFRVYSAVSAAWERQNPTYAAVQGYTGSLSVPSAGLSVRATAQLDLGRSQLFLICDFGGQGGLRQGLTLADLSDLTGTAGLLSALPEQIRDLGSAIGRLALVQAQIGLSLSSGGFSVDLVMVAAGFPDVQWKIYGDDLVVQDVLARFSVRQPFAGAQVTVELAGMVSLLGTPVRVGASSADGFTVFAALAAQARIPLAALLQTYAPGVPAPSDLTIDRLNVTVVPGTSYEMSMAMAEAPNPWILPVGPGSLRVTDLELWLRYDTALAGSFSGDISFADTVELSIDYDIPGDLTIRGTFPSVRLSEILAKVVDARLPLPDGFDITFAHTAVLIQKKGSAFVFQVGTDVEGFGLFAMEVRHTGGAAPSGAADGAGSAAGWGFAVGMDLGAGRVAQLPALGPLGPLVAAVDLDQLVLVVSTFDDAGFDFPDASAFDDPAITGRLPAAGSGGVQQGFNFFGRWSLDPSNRFQNLLRDLLGITALDLAIAVHVSLPDPGQNSSVFAAISAQIAGWALQGQFGVRLLGDTPQLFVAGELTVAIQGQPRTFYVESTLVDNGVFVAGSFTSGTPVTISIEGVELFQIGDLAVAVGCDFEGIPSFGVAGTIAEGGFASSLAVFVNSAEPQKSLVAGSLSDLSLGDVLRALTGGAASDIAAVLDMVAITGTRTFTIPGDLAADLDGLTFDRVADAFAANGVSIPNALPGLFLVVGKPGTTWFLTALNGDDEVRHYELRKQGDGIEVTLEAQIYCVPETTSLGKLTFHGPQFFINGGLRLFGLQAQATVTVEPARGFAVDAQMSPIVIYRPSLFSITSAQNAELGPRISGATFTQPDLPDPALREAHLLIDGQVQILGLKRQVFVRATTDGLLFDITGDVSPGVRLQAHGHVGGLTDLGFGGAATVGVGTIDLGPLGSVAVNTDAGVTLDVGYQGSTASAQAGVRFEFAGDAHEIDGQLDVTGSQLADLAGYVYDQVKAFLLARYQDAKAWVEDVANKLVSGVDDAVQVLVSVFKMTETAALTLYNDVMEAAQKVCAVTRAALAL